MSAMNDLLRLSSSEGSTTSIGYSVEATDDKDVKTKADSIKANGSNPTTSKGTKRRSVGIPSRRQDYKRSETQVLEFKDSQAVRNAVYEQWLLEKKARIKEKKITETKSKSLLQDEEAKAMAKKEQIKADAMKAYDKWKTSKDEDLGKKLKLKQQEKEREEEEATKTKEKQHQAQQAIAAWQKKKDENLKIFLTSQAKKHEEEKQRLEQEAERKAISKLAFDKWVEKKRKVLSETQKIKKSHDQDKEQKNNTHNQTLAFEEWKKKKDEQIKLQKSTKNVEKEIHKKPWRPARSIEYDYYLKTPKPLPNEISKSNNISSSSSSTSSLSSIPQSSIKPRLKSVKVCCQTLEYWCVCQK